MVVQLHVLVDELGLRRRVEGRGGRGGEEERRPMEGEGRDLYILSL